MDDKVYPTLGHIVWQTNMLIGVTSTNFGYYRGMTLMSKTMQPILVAIRTII
jgi:hypothetical protein